MLNGNELKNKSLFQERLAGLFLRLNGYFQSGYIPHSKQWGNAGTDIDRVAVRFPKHSQSEREVDSSPLLKIPKDSIDIVVAEVKNDSLFFNDPLTTHKHNANENWKQLLNWIGLFEDNEVLELIPKLINIANKHCLEENDSFPMVEHKNTFGLITIRPMLFIIDKTKENNGKLWINGDEILEFIWICFCPEVKRAECSTRYPFALWGTEYSDIVNYLKHRHKNGLDLGALSEMYAELIE